MSSYAVITQLSLYFCFCKAMCFCKSYMYWLYRKKLYKMSLQLLILQGYMLLPKLPSQQFCLSIGYRKYSKMSSYAVIPQFFFFVILYFVELCAFVAAIYTNFVYVLAIKKYKVSLYPSFCRFMCFCSILAMKELVICN